MKAARTLVFVILDDHGEAIDATPTLDAAINAKRQSPGARISATWTPAGVTV